MDKPTSKARRVAEVAAKLIGHPACPLNHCSGRLRVVVVPVDERRKRRIGGARVYQCERCGREIVMTRATGAPPYLNGRIGGIERIITNGPKRKVSRVDKRQIELGFGDTGK